MESVVLLTVDCLRADHLGCYGYDRATSPNIDGFADEATRYAHAYANCPGTRWAFQSIHGGVWSPRIDGLGIPDGFPMTMAEGVRDQGYATAAFSVNAFLNREFGYDRGFDVYRDADDFEPAAHPLVRAGRWIDDVVDSERLRGAVLRPIRDTVRGTAGGSEGFRPPVTDSDVVDAAIDWLDGLDDDRPYFLWIHFMDAHTPYGRWDEHFDAIGADPADHVVEPDEDLGREDRGRVVDTYDACLREADRQVDRVLDRVEDDATVILTGDHGEEFGRYNVFHWASFYSSMTQVPMIVRSPDTVHGVVDGYPVQHLDVMPTVLEATGRDPPAFLGGEPLQTVERASNDPIFFAFDDHVAVRTGKWKLVRTEGYGDGTDRGHGDVDLFRTPHSEDDDEPVDVGKHTDVADRLDEALDDFERRLGSRRYGGGTADEEGALREVSDAVEQNLEQLGYLE